ncbi:MAG: BlaI/MecI/CopY family transcriptional regulator [Eubacterium sp.]|nr:BlaI/MecI/CopY family transcriptional regulator [Eubacterium sp.]
MDYELNKSEWKVMRYLWENEPCTLMELVRHMAQELGWSKSTTNTVMKRMLEKGMVAYEKEGKAREYVAVYKREEVRLAETENFVDRVFGGDVGLLVNNLVSSKKLNQKEIDEIQALLDQVKESGMEG